MEKKVENLKQSHRKKHIDISDYVNKLVNQMIIESATRRARGDR